MKLLPATFMALLAIAISAPIPSVSAGSPNRYWDYNPNHYGYYPGETSGAHHSSSSSEAGSPVRSARSDTPSPARSQSFGGATPVYASSGRSSSGRSNNDYVDDIVHGFGNFHVGPSSPYHYNDIYHNQIHLGDSPQQSPDHSVHSEAQHSESQSDGDNSVASHDDIEPPGNRHHEPHRAFLSPYSSPELSASPTSTDSTSTRANHERYFYIDNNQGVMRETSSDSDHGSPSPPPSNTGGAVVPARRRRGIRRLFGLRR